MRFADTAAMNARLAKIARAIARRAVLVFDDAGRHGGHALVVPRNVSCPLLPIGGPVGIPWGGGVFGAGEVAIRICGQGGVRSARPEHTMTRWPTTGNSCAASPRRRCRTSRRQSWWA